MALSDAQPWGAPDWTEFRTAMITEQRLVLTVTATHAYGVLPA